MLPRDAVLWAYRLLLDREPESEAVLAAHQALHDRPASLAEAFIHSPEYQARHTTFITAELPYVTSAEVDLSSRLGCYEGPAEDGFWIDFLGTRTRVEFLAPPYAWLAGQVTGSPLRGGATLHEVAEWHAFMRSIAEAEPGRRLTAVELGAGFGPWLVAAALAARRLGLPEPHLLAAEADPVHLEFLRRHFRENGLDPDRFPLLHCAVGAADGTAWFPRDVDSRLDWGQAARFAPAEDRDMMALPCRSIASLLAGLPPVDLLHVDIQGAEAEALPPAIATLDNQVRRVVVGTHGREIEGLLLRLFSTAGWLLEHEQPCRYAQRRDERGLELIGDGVQVWSNPRLGR